MGNNVFNYEGIKQVYSDISNIIGSSDQADSIAGILTQLDKDVHDDVNVCEESVYGPLGKQLLLSWENISSDFPAFLNNFDNWSKMISSSAYNYEKFETEVSAARGNNPYGSSPMGLERTTNYIEDGKLK